MMNQILIATILAGPPALPPGRGGDVDVETTGAPADLQHAETLYDEGTVRYDAADYLGAVEKFTEALAIVKREGGDDHVRLTLLYNIGQAHEKQHEIDRDVTHLRQALALYRQYREFAESKGDLDDQLDVEGKILRLEKKLRAHDQIMRNRQKTADAGDPSPPEPPDVDEDPSWRRHRNLGVGLTVAGGAAVVGGVVVAVLGSRYESKARAQVDELADLGVPMDHPAWEEGEDFVAQEKRKGAVLMGVGGSLAAAGAVGAGVGIFYLVKARKAKASRVSATPVLAPGFAGVQLTGRF